MPDCVQCGLPVPEGQSVCSMCYGDPYYGSDGYYLEWLEEELRRAAEEAAWEEAMMEEEEAT